MEEGTQSNNAQIPTPITDMSALNEVINNLDIPAGNPSEVPAAVPAQQEAASAQEQASASVPESESPSNQAFAAMRVANKQQQAQLAAQTQVMQQMLSFYGMDPSLAANPEELQAVFREAQLAQQAEEQKVPVQLLQDVDVLKQQAQQQQQVQQQNVARSNFAELMKAYKLDQNTAYQFLLEVQADGYDPITMSLPELQKEYVYRHLDSFLNQAKAQGVATQAQNVASAQASAHLPPPTSSVPGNPNAGGKITTAAQLDSLLAQMPSL